MNYKYTQEYLNAGDIVRITLDKQANVLLLDSTNFQRFKSGSQYKYFGGLVTQSPADIPVPSTGNWYIVIHLGGYGGSIKHSIQIIR